ncbi:MAG: hypothetical protein U9N84_07225 [Actinomycetota bacterium]|nr:hypothetical protein [Actinomycetota bacterium]
MKTLNRVLTVLLVTLGGVLVWAAIAQTNWAATRSLVGVGELYENPLSPLIKVAGVFLVAIAATKLIRSCSAMFGERVLGHDPKSRVPVHRPSENS